MRVNEIDTVTITAPARLHLGFIDPSGMGERRFGSVGLTLDQPRVRLHARRAAEFSVQGVDAARAQRLLELLRARCKLEVPVALRIDQAIPPHAGLGSGTQLALAIGHALARLNSLPLTSGQLAHATERGARSGIGVGAFERGGFLVDGGVDASDEPAPIVARMEIPHAWRVVLIHDEALQGLHGPAETAAFRQSRPFARRAQLSEEILLGALPALAQGDLRAFGRAIAALQHANGDYFAPLQGGRYASPRVAEVLAWLEQLGERALGQSSWGPTGFAIVESSARADALVEAARLRWGTCVALSFHIHSARNEGAQLVTERVPARAARSA